MSFSIQTNVNSLIAQENLRVNNEFQSRTIGRLTSGYRINSSGDDAAGLAVANKYRSDVVELQQGVRNANDGISALQIVDGGLNNISKILDRLKTLATQSASTTFTGDRATLNNEYQDLLTEITRQASNIGMVAGGRYNTVISVYGGGGNVQSNAKVTVDLSGSANQVDATALGLSSTTVGGGGSTLSGGTANTVNTLNSGTQTYLAGGTQIFDVRLYEDVNGDGVIAAETASVTISGGTSGITASEALRQLNAGLSRYGVTAAANSSGYLVLGGTRAFSFSASTISAGNGLATAGGYGENQALYRYSASSWTAPTTPQTLTFTYSGGTKTVTIAATSTLAAALTSINAQTASVGIYAVNDGSGSGFSIQSTGSFSLSSAASGGLNGVVAGGSSATISSPDAAASVTANAESAITKIATAITNLGQVQGRVGTGQNKLQFAIQLAQSQISNFSAAESRIRDADVAAEAANLTKAQVLQQASLAAMAQANSAPQAVLSLLRG